MTRLATKFFILLCVLMFSTYFLLNIAESEYKTIKFLPIDTQSHVASDRLSLIRLFSIPKVANDGLISFNLDDFELALKLADYDLQQYIERASKSDFASPYIDFSLEEMNSQFPGKRFDLYGKISQDSLDQLAYKISKSDGIYQILDLDDGIYVICAYEDYVVDTSKSSGDLYKPGILLKGCYPDVRIDVDSPPFANVCLMTESWTNCKSNPTAS